MEKMKSLADQLRDKMVKPPANATMEKKGIVNPKKTAPKVNQSPDSALLQLLTEYDNSDHKTMVHFRFDKQTVDFLNQFKIATGVDATKFVAYSVRQFIDAHPELKIIIKQFIQNAYL
jgi:hypothetical protein